MKINWLPGLMSQSVLKNKFPCHLPSLERKRQQEITPRGQTGTTIMAKEWQSMIDQGKVKNRAELARRVGVSRARVTQVLSITNHQKDISIWQL